MNFHVTQEFQLLLSFLTFCASTYLGAVVYLNNRTNWTNRLFGLLAFVIDIYITVNYLSLHPPLPSVENQLFWIRLVMCITSFIGPILILLVHTFPHEKITLAWRYRIPLFALMSVSAIFSLTPLVFSALEFPNGEPVPVPGAGIPVFALDFVGLFLLSFFVLIYKYRKASDQERAQHKFLLFGVLASFSLMALSTVIFVVVLHSSATVFLGPIVPVILMASIAYAIVKYQLFNIKIIATQVSIVTIWIILFSKIFANITLTEFTVDIFVFILVVLFGIVLNHSVHREIREREEVTRLAKSLEKANLRLQELDQQKTEFLSIASHQLRTPLSILKGYIELIADGAYGKPSKRLLGTLSDMDENNERLIKLVDEFLNISRIEQGRTKFSFVKKDMALLIKDVIKELEERAKDKGLQIEMLFPGKKAIISMDDDKIRHVLFNFIDNSIKYSDQGTITVGVKKEEEGVAVRVTDAGIGFNKTDEVNFFQKFYRGENVKTTNVNGTGLGLYVCRKFIEAHGGKVWATSMGLGRGSEFGFWIPNVRPVMAKEQ